MSVKLRGRLDPYEALLMLEERFELGLFAWDLQSEEVVWSDGMYSLAGRRPGEDLTIGKVLSWGHPDDRISLPQLRRMIAEGSHRMQHKLRMIGADGSVRHMVCSYRLKQEKGLSYIVGACMDASALIEARAIGAIDRARFRTLRSSFIGDFWLADERGQNFQKFSSGGRGDQAAIAEQSWVDLIHPDERQGVVCQWSDAVERGAAGFEKVHRTRMPDGTYHLAITRAAPLKSSSGQTIEWVGSTLDVDRFVNPLHGEQQVYLTGAQVRAGRAVLNWSVQDLADQSGISISVIRRIEQYDGAATREHGTTFADLQKTMEQAGVEFLMLPAGKPAVRPR